jgi:3-hydroxy-9,10-secoandrosta-1,3,5(10)-triene-9,17-dione monooxygenase
MEITQAPPREELVRRASGLIPLLREKAAWMEENRRLHEDVLDALTDAGILRMRTPLRYGGYESDTGTVVDVVAELGRGDGSVAWTVGVWMIATWEMGLFPDEAQDEIFANPDARICGILSPTAVAVPTDGGYIINGTWKFNTGVKHSTWNNNAALVQTDDGGFEVVTAVIPVADLEIIDDWHTSGLRASGSITTIAKDLFLPKERVLFMRPMMEGAPHQSKLNANAPIFKAPLLPTACAVIAAPAFGLAMGAKDAFLERLPGRKITYTSYENQAEAPVTHLEIAEAITRIDEAGFHAHRAADMVDTKGPAGEPWSFEERARVRLDLGAASQRAKEAVDILVGASGGSSIYSDVPIQRIQRDLQALNLHAILHPSTNLELYGRIICGLEPNTAYI